MNVPEVIQGCDITEGREQMIAIFLACLFKCNHGLEKLSTKEIEAVVIVDEDIEASKEERVFRLWITSLNIPGVNINNLYDDCKDGILLCKVIHYINDKVIDWKKVENVPKNDFGRNGNNGVAVAGCKAMGLRMIGISGGDITKGDVKSILAMIWQICRLHYLKLIGDKTELDLVNWANQIVNSKTINLNKDLKTKLSISSLKDKKNLNDGRFLIYLCGSIEPRFINWDLVTEGKTDEEKKLNAKYAIALARKLGAVLFCVWEDIVNVNYK